MATLRAGTAALFLGYALAEETHDNPIQRVVGLLKDMQATLNKDMEDDEALFDKLNCWCRTNRLQKGDASKASEEKIAELQSTIESGTARSKQLKEEIASLESTFAADKAALAEAEELRKKQLKDFQDNEDASIVAIENCKAAITVLAKHQDEAFPQLRVSLLQNWHDTSSAGRDFDQFLSNEGVFDHIGDELVAKKHLRAQPEHLKPDAPSHGWATNDVDVVRRALKSAAAFVQARGGQAYFPSYESKSGEIVGVLKTMFEEMSAELKADQEKEADRVATFTEMRAAKRTAIADGEKMSERKEDELATLMNDVAEAKEDLKAEGVALGDTEAFSKNLEKTCAEASSNFDARKKGRMEEIQAVSETINILQGDEARDAISATYSFLQQRSSEKRVRSLAAAKLRRAAALSGNPSVALLASSVELDAFTEVKKAIDDMVAELKVQQADEVKKNDYCKESLQEAEMKMAKTDEEKNDLLSKEESLKSKIAALEKGIVDANNNIETTKVNLKRAGEDREMENSELQTTLRDQKVTAEILKKALKKLSKFYGFVQQTPPVAQMTYEKNSGSAGIMQMIEKLIEEAHKMSADALTAENEAQLNYETLVADTTNTLKALGSEIWEKKRALTKTKTELGNTQQDIIDIVKDMEGIADYQTGLHEECDYILKNFDLRQNARTAEMEALAEAKSILSGATR